jgi:hypothetical protein
VVIGALVLRIVAFIAVLIKPNGAFRTTTKSARDVVEAAVGMCQSSEPGEALYLSGSEVTQPGLEAKDAQKAAWLWNSSLNFAGLQHGETMLENWR